MLQRIQTVYLLATTLLLVAMFFYPLADITAGGVILSYNIQGIFEGSEKLDDATPLLGFLVLILFLHLFVIFSYKKRIRQIRVLVFTMVLLAGFFGLIFFFAHAGHKGAIFSYHIPVAFPVVAAILDYLAIRNIGRDEALVRSINRLRR